MSRRAWREKKVEKKSKEKEKVEQKSQEKEKVEKKSRAEQARIYIFKSNILHYHINNITM